MSYDPQDNYLIEKYILGKLNETETRAFELRIANDREFARKHRLIKAFPEMMSEPAKKEYDQQRAKEAVSEKEIKKIHFPKTKYLLLTTSAIIFVVVIFFIFHSKPHEKTELQSSAPSFQDTIKKPVKQEVPAVKIIPAVLNPLETKPVETKPAEIKSPEKKTGPVELVNPTEGVSFSRSEEIHFKWIQPTDSFTRLYIFSEGKNNLVLWRGIPSGVRDYRIAGKILYPGTFYWFVGSKNVKQRFIIKP